MQTAIFHDVFTYKEIQDILDYFESQPYSTTEEIGGVIYSKHKNLDYQIPTSYAHQKIVPKINSIVGKDHKIFMGSYKECYQSYGLHYDSPRSLSRFESKYQFHSETKHNVAVLIPLVEHAKFKTVVFDVFDQDVSNKSLMFEDQHLTSSNDLDLDEFTHEPKEIRKKLNQLPIDIVFQWNVGDVVTWDRQQLHCSTDFAKHGLVKKFIILFIA